MDRWARERMCARDEIDHLVCYRRRERERDETETETETERQRKTMKWLKAEKKTPNSRAIAASYHSGLKFHSYVFLSNMFLSVETRNITHYTTQPTKYLQL